MSGVGAAALPVLSGLLLAFSYPPFPLAPVVFVGLVPLLLYIVDRPAGARGRWEATRGGITTGVVYFGIQLYWMATALLRYSLLAIPAYLGAVLVLTGLTAAFAWAVHYTRARLDLPLPIAAAVFWTAMEWTQAHLGDLAFPWLGLGTALAPFPALAGAADLVGARGLTFWIAGVNGLLASTLLLYRARRPFGPPLLGLLLTLALPAAYGGARWATLELEPAAQVAVVQPNIPEDIKLGPLALDSSLSTLRTLTRSLEGEALDLVVWPEVALPADFLRSGRLREVTLDLSKSVGAPILVGAYGVDDGDPTRYNSAFLVDVRGRADQGAARYDKQRLVPFIERVPFVDSQLLAHASDAPGNARREGEPGVRLGRLGRGHDRPVLGTRTGAPFGVLICYESIFAPLARDYRASGAAYLVNITNDAWYGHDSWWGRTTALWQHPAHMVMRAIETRTGVARAANTGISLFVDPLGRIHGRTTLFEPAVSIATVQTTRVTTLFVRWGDTLGMLSMLFAVAALFASWIRGRAEKEDRTG